MQNSSKPFRLFPFRSEANLENGSNDNHDLEVGERGVAALQATQGQIDGLSSKLPYNCHLEEVASVRD